MEGVIARGGGLLTRATDRPRNNAPRKRLRTSRACDFCHNRSIKCRQNPGETRCQNCIDFDVPCKYDRPAKKRGIQSRRQVSAPAQDLSAGEEVDLLLQFTNGAVKGYQQQAPPPRSILGVEPARRHGEAIANITSFPLASQHQDLALRDAGEIADLVNVYFEVVYPM